MHTFLVYGSVWLLAQAALFGAPGEVRAERSATDLPNSERLITAFPKLGTLPISADSQDLAAWPSAETQNAQHAQVDRSKTLPPVFQQPKKRDAKPIRMGALTPAAARKEAEQWIRRVLKPEWVPNDLAARLHLLQREPASLSIIVCRYAIDGCAIQITQNRSSMWVVIKPRDDASLGGDASGIEQAMFPTYFLMGDRMAALYAKSVDGTAKLRIWAPNFSAPIPPGALENWWGWRLWVTDGKALAVYLGKASDDSAHTVTPDEPWF
jgi:hypothetical protein